MNDWFEIKPEEPLLVYEQLDSTKKTEVNCRRSFADGSPQSRCINFGCISENKKGGRFVEGGCTPLFFFSQKHPHTEKLNINW